MEAERERQLSGLEALMLASLPAAVSALRLKLSTDDGWGEGMVLVLRADLALVLDAAERAPGYSVLSMASIGPEIATHGSAPVVPRRAGLPVPKMASLRAATESPEQEQA